MQVKAGGVWTEGPSSAPLWMILGFPQDPNNNIEKKQKTKKGYKNVTTKKHV